MSDTDNIVNLREVPSLADPVNQALVAMLKDLLAEAKAGRIHTMASVALRSNGELIDSLAFPAEAAVKQPVLLLGTLEILRQRILAHIEA